MFADRYIHNNVVYQPFIREQVNPELSMVVMIPCMEEPEIFRTLDSLWACVPVASCCEVLVVLNEPEDCNERITRSNELNYSKLLDWKVVNDRDGLVLHPFYARGVAAKHAGAGMARKIGMDEAVRRFNAINRPEGIIVSLDADCLVSVNYLHSIETFFMSNKSCFAATINFRHRIDEIEDLKLKAGIDLYENYLHYYKKALAFSGFPNAIYTIGSAFAVRANAYVKQGGMNRRQAGEDFYFLNKLTHLGQVAEINDAFVFPSGRVSDRVPFGTGAAMGKWMSDADNLALTYRFSAFRDLKDLFDRVELLYKNKPDEQFMKSLPIVVQNYLATLNFNEKVAEINANSSTLTSFCKRFYQFFDAFVVLRFLNYAHQSHYQEQSLLEAMTELAQLSS